MERVNKRVAGRNPVGPGHSAIWLLHPATARERRIITARERRVSESLITVLRITPPCVQPQP